MESKANNRDLHAPQDQKLAGNLHAIRPEEDLEAIRKAVYRLEQYLKKCDESKGAMRAHEEVRQILGCIQELSDEKESNSDEQNRKKIRELLVRLLEKENPAVPNKLLFDAAYELLFIWVKYYPKNKQDKHGRFICFFNHGQLIDKGEERFIIPILGYQYKATDTFFDCAASKDNKGWISCEEGVITLQPRDTKFLKQECIRMGKLQLPPPAPPRDRDYCNEPVSGSFIGIFAGIGLTIGFCLIQLLLALNLAFLVAPVICLTGLLGAIIGYGLYKALEGAYNLISMISDWVHSPKPVLPISPNFQLRTNVTERLLISQVDKVPELKKDDAVNQQISGKSVEFPAKQSPHLAHALLSNQAYPNVPSVSSPRPIPRAP